MSALDAQHVRSATPDDIDELVRLRAYLLEEAPSADLPYAVTSPHQSALWREAYRAWLSEHLCEDGPLSVVVVPGAGRLRACATAVIDQRAPSPACPSGRAGWVQSVVTDPRDRGCGLGTAILDHLTAWLRARGVDEIVLQTTPAAADFYRRAGFLASGEDLLFKPLHIAEKAL
ncbi:GNAT family N-acetyltransferase [Streptomyces tubercidicus]|uniref:GNAT family N-acetyltransferase n=1 Tax=Streptomyces tubercidicus TaxID=47759 RepID=UPI0034660868